ncbi:MAG: helix-turn-helix domain-containing protein [Myxococcaceae bacterium]
MEEVIDEAFKAMVKDAVREVLREELAELRSSTTPSPADDELLTVDQVAARCGHVKPATVREWIHSGQLQAQRAGHRLLVAPAALQVFLAARNQVATVSTCAAARPSHDDQAGKILSMLEQRRASR